MALGYDAARTRNLLSIEQTRRLAVLLALTKYAALDGMSDGEKVRLGQATLPVSPPYLPMISPISPH